MMRKGIATNKLDVTCHKGGMDDTTWTGYQIRNGKNGCRAHIVCVYPTLDAVRGHAEKFGFDGLIIGAPSVAWA